MLFGRTQIEQICPPEWFEKGKKRRENAGNGGDLKKQKRTPRKFGKSAFCVD